MEKNRSLLVDIDLEKLEKELLPYGIFTPKRKGKKVEAERRKAAEDAFRVYWVATHDFPFVGADTYEKTCHRVFVAGYLAAG